MSLGTTRGRGLRLRRAPQANKTTRPQYPKDALEKHIEGTVVLEIVIDAKGHVVMTQTTR